MTLTTSPVAHHSAEVPNYENITPPRRSPSNHAQDPPDAQPAKEAGLPLHTLTTDQLTNTGTPVLLFLFSNFSTASSGDFNLSQYLVAPHELRQSTPKTAPYAPPMSFRPWTLTPSTSTGLSPTLPLQQPENEEDDRRPEPSSINT